MVVVIVSCSVFNVAVTAAAAVVVAVTVVGSSPSTMLVIAEQAVKIAAAAALPFKRKPHTGRIRSRRLAFKCISNAMRCYRYLFRSNSHSGLSVFRNYVKERKKCLASLGARACVCWLVLQAFSHSMWFAFGIGGKTAICVQCADLKLINANKRFSNFPTYIQMRGLHFFAELRVYVEKWVSRIFHKNLPLRFSSAPHSLDSLRQWCCV